MLPEKLLIEDRAERLKPLDNQLILTVGILVTVLGVCGLIGRLTHHDFLASFTAASNPALMAIPTAIAFIFLGIGIKTILDTQPYDGLPQWLWPVRYTSFMVPIVVGLWGLSQYIHDKHFNWFDISTYGLHFIAIPTCVLLVLAGIALFVFMKWQRHEGAVVYGVCIPAFIVLNIGIVGVIGYFHNLPILYAVRLVLPSAMAAVLTGLILLVGTIPYKGLCLPVLSYYPQARLLAILSALSGVLVVVVGVNSLAVALKTTGVGYSLSSGQNVHYVITEVLYGCTLIGIAINVIGLRASRYYDQALRYAQEQKLYAREQEALARELQLNRERFDLLVDSVKDYAIFSLDLNGNITSWGRGPERITHYRAEEVLGKSFSLLIPPEDSGMVDKELFLAAQTGHAQFEGWRIKKGGIRFWASVNSTALRDPEGNLLGYIKIIRDLSDRRKQEDKIQTIINSDVLGIFFWNQATGQITEANNAFLRMLGYTREDLQRGSLNWKSLTPSEFQELDEHSLTKMRENTQGKAEPLEKQYFKKNGERLDVLLAGAFFPGQQEDGVAFVLDISPQKQAERALKDSRQQLVESNRDLEYFATIASHDLQAPLRKVRIFAAQLEEDLDGKLTQENRDTLSRIQNATAHMQEMISDILALSKVSRLARAFETVDLSKVVSKVLFNLDERIKEQGAQIEVGNLAVVKGDELQMEQLLQNLIDNAIKYQPPGQRAVVRVSATCSGKEWCQITVADNGIGIRREELERIFQPFERLHGRSSVYQGTGVGLAICKRIVERHGGTIEVQSDVGMGSVFVIHLPQQESALLAGVH